MEYKNWSAWSLCLPLRALPHPQESSVTLSIGLDPPEVLTFFPGFSDRMDSPSTMQWANLLAQIPRPRGGSSSGTLPGTLKTGISHCPTLSAHCVILEYTSGVQTDDRSLLLDVSPSMLSTGQPLVSLPILLPLAQHCAICQGSLGCLLLSLPQHLLHLHEFTRILYVLLLKRTSYPQLSTRSCEASHNLRMGTVFSEGSK